MKNLINYLMNPSRNLQVALGCTISRFALISTAVINCLLLCGFLGLTDTEDYHALGVISGLLLVTAIAVEIWAFFKDVTY